MCRLQKGTEKSLNVYAKLLMYQKSKYIQNKVLTILAAQRIIRINDGFEFCLKRATYIYILDIHQVVYYSLKVNNVQPHYRYHKEGILSAFIDVQLKMLSKDKAQPLKDMANVVIFQATECVIRSITKIQSVSLGNISLEHKVALCLTRF